MKKILTLLVLMLCFQIGEAKNSTQRHISLEKVKVNMWESSVKAKDNITTAMAAPPISIIVEAIKAGIKKVIRSLDLVFQRLQQVQLQVQAGLEYAKNVLSETRLSEVNDLVTEKKEIFDKYYQELWTVKNKLDQVKAIKNAVLAQGKLIEGFNSIFTKFSGDMYLSEKELTIIYNVYVGMLEKNVNSINDLVVLIKNYTVKMQDGDRLSLIQAKLMEIENVAVDFNGFTSEVIKLSLSRVKDGQQINEMKLYYGLEI